MPGLVGFIHHEPTLKTILEKMQERITHQSFHVRDVLFVDNGVHCTRSHINIIQKDAQPFENKCVYVWLDGEFYNQTELVGEYKVAKSDPVILAELYEKHRNLSFLQQIDGIYSAVIFDKPQRKVFLLTDRYGLRHLYWSSHGGHLAWASEIKAFLCLPWLHLTIDQQSVKEFFSVGHLLENRTWFNQVSLIPPGTVLTYDLVSTTLEKTHYWSWDQIRPIQDSIDEITLSEELGKRFVCSIGQRCRKGEKVGVSLSGGLDSRAILAAMPDDIQPIHAVTFGKKNCDDVRIASMVAKRKGVEHHIFEINETNWLEPRFQHIWYTDGQFNVLDMHGLEFMLSYATYFDINLSGFLGDALLGGSYIDDKTYGDLEKFRNRGRRFINLALISARNFQEVRFPFFDNALMELTISIPERYRINSSIYNKMLLHTFPQYYQSIPWQKTGCPISYSARAVQLVALKKRIIRKIKRESRRFGLHFRDVTDYTDYPAWLRQEPARSFFRRLLLSKQAIYPEYIEQRKVQQYMELHLQEKGNYQYELGLALTFELWLQQVYKGKYRQKDEK